MDKLFGFLKKTKGNPRVCLATDLMWAAPFNMFTPFAAMYMMALGLDDVQIGTLLSINLVSSFVMALLGGAIVNKYGRKWTLIIGDILAWSIPAFIWAFSQNFTWFLVATIFNSTSQIAMVAFECLWLDDLEERKIYRMTTWLHISFLFAIFFGLITGVLVESHGIVPAMRIVYLFSFIILNIRLVILCFYLKETEQGKKQLEETKGKSIFVLMSGYKEIFLQILNSPKMRKVLILMPMVTVFQLIRGTFFALYATQELLISEAFLAYFPAVQAGVALFFFFFIQHRLRRFTPKYLMCVGLIMYISGHVLLLLAPPQNMPWLMAFALVDAFAAALFLPWMDTLLFGSLDPEERANCRSLINVAVLIVSSPFGLIAGLLSDMDRRLPFVLNMVILFIIMVVVTLGRDSMAKGSASS